MLLHIGNNKYYINSLLHPGFVPFNLQFLTPFNIYKMNANGIEINRESVAEVLMIKLENVTWI